MWRTRAAPAVITGPIERNELNDAIEPSRVSSKQAGSRGIRSPASVILSPKRTELIELVKEARKYLFYDQSSRGTCKACFICKGPFEKRTPHLARLMTSVKVGPRNKEVDNLWRYHLECQNERKDSSHFQIRRRQVWFDNTTYSAMFDATQLGMVKKHWESLEP
jgi:hypothetical protein